MASAKLCKEPSSQWVLDGFPGLPEEIKEIIFEYVSVTDLCHMAMVSRSWREAANMDSLWRRFCREKSWEHYGTSDDITKLTPYVPLPSSDDQQVAHDPSSVETSSEEYGLNESILEETSIDEGSLKKGILKEDSTKKRIHIEGGLKEDSLREDIPKEDSIKEDHPKDDSLEEDRLKENILKEDSLKEGPSEDCIFKEESLKEDSPEEDRIKESFLKEDSPKENNIKEGGVKEDISPHERNWEEGSLTEDNWEEASSEEDTPEEISDEYDSDEYVRDWSKFSYSSLGQLDPSRYRDIAFNEDCIIGNDNGTGLVGTCRWKEIFMKARHLENNWDRERYNAVSYDLDDHEFDNNYECAESEAFLKADDDYLVACVEEHSCRILKIWNLKAGNRHQINLNNKLGHFVQNMFQVKNGIVVIGCKDGIIRAFSLSSGEELQVMKGHKAVEVVDVFFDGETIVSRAKSDNDVRVWNVADGTCQRVLCSPSEDTEVKELDYRDGMVAASYSDDCVRLWDTKSDECIRTLGRPETTKKYPATEWLCKLGDSIVACYYGEESGICIWSKDSGEIVANIPCYIDRLFCEWGLIIGQSYEDEIDVYDETGTPLKNPAFLAGKGWPMCFHKNRCVFECRESDYDPEEEEPWLRCTLLKMTKKGLNFMWSIDDYKDCNRYVHVLWMDNTKIILSDGDNPLSKRFEDRYLICHFW